MIENRRILVIGKSGSGKSWLVEYILERDIIDNEKNFLIFDPKGGEHNGFLDFPGARVLIVGREVFPHVNNEFCVGLLRMYKRLIVIPNMLDFAEIRKLMDCMSYAALQVGNLVVVLEEAQLIYPHNQTLKWSEILVTSGRSNHIDVIIVTQRPSEIDSTVVSQCNIRFFFQMDDEPDLERVKSLLKDAKKLLPELRPKQCYYRNYLTGENGFIDTSKYEKEKVVGHRG
jgi:DNA helicase HerA-like ATPase